MRKSLLVLWIISAPLFVACERTTRSGPEGTAVDQMHAKAAQLTLIGKERLRALKPPAVGGQWIAFSVQPGHIKRTTLVDQPMRVEMTYALTMRVDVSPDEYYLGRMDGTFAMLTDHLGNIGEKIPHDPEPPRIERWMYGVKDVFDENDARRKYWPNYRQEIQELLR